MTFFRKPLRILIICGLILASIWLLQYGRLQHLVHFKDYAYTADEAAKLKRSAAAQYDYGRRAFDDRDFEAAASYLRSAVLTDPLHISAWLKLAEVERELGNRAAAAEIVEHNHDLTRRVLRWKWPETLLAYELDLEDVLTENVDFLIANGKQRWDAVRLLDIYYHRQAGDALSALAPENRLAYMQWLMRWERTEDVRLAWDGLPETERKDSEFRLSYVDYLVGQKRVDEARLLWDADNEASFTNSGFEQEILQKGFGWRFRDGPDQLWRVRRVTDSEGASNHVLEVKFTGRENLRFHHLYQVLPVRPLAPYRLSYRWKADELTTDQGPFVEVYGYDCGGLREAGPMMLGSVQWREAAFEFTPPEGCHAVVVRLRRNTSGRFDSKINGTLWLDDFKLDRIQTALPENEHNPVLSER